MKQRVIIIYWLNFSRQTIYTRLLSFKVLVWINLSVELESGSLSFLRQVLSNFTIGIHQFFYPTYAIHEAST